MSKKNTINEDTLLAIVALCKQLSADVEECFNLGEDDVRETISCMVDNHADQVQSIYNKLNHVEETKSSIMEANPYTYVDTPKALDPKDSISIRNFKYLYFEWLAKHIAKIDYSNIENADLWLFLTEQTSYHPYFGKASDNIYFYSANDVREHVATLIRNNRKSDPQIKLF